MFFWDFGFFLLLRVFLEGSVVEGVVEVEDEVAVEGAIGGSSNSAPFEFTTLEKYFEGKYPRSSPSVNITPFADVKNTIPPEGE